MGPFRQPRTGRRILVYSSPGYCRCGEEVWIEYLWNGKAWGNRFHDAEHGEIDHCPSCGTKLEEEELESI